MFKHLADIAHVSNTASEHKLLPVIGGLTWSWRKTDKEIYHKWEEYGIRVKMMLFSHCSFYFIIYMFSEHIY